MFKSKFTSNMLEEDEIVQLNEELGWLVIDEQPELKIIGEVDKVKLPIRDDPFSAIVHIKAPKDDQSSEARNARAPVDLVTVLDVSGSMQGEKLELLKTAMEFVIRNLRSQDRLSIISFSDNSYTDMGFKRMTNEGRSLAILVVERLRARAGTNICSGLISAFSLLSSRKRRNPVSSIMLLSDGMDTTISAGETLPVERYLNIDSDEPRVPVHTFGFGNDHDANSMLSIAEATGGSFCYIEEESTVQHAFAQCLGGLLSVVAQEVELSILASGGASLLRINGAPVANASTHVVKLGSLYAEEERDILVEISLSSSSSLIANPVEVLKVGGSFRDPGGMRQLSKVSLVIRACGDGEEEELIKVEVERHKNRVAASAAMAAARELELEEAKRVLEGAKAKIESSRAFRAGDELSRTLVMEIGELLQRMTSRSLFEMQGGRAMMLARANSHQNQRAAFNSSARARVRPAGVNLKIDEEAEVQMFGSAVLEPSSSYVTSAMMNMVAKSEKFKSQRTSNGDPTKNIHGFRRKPST